MVVCLVLTFFIFLVVYVLIISMSAWWWMNSFSTPGLCHFLEKKTLKEKKLTTLFDYKCQTARRKTEYFILIYISSE